MDKSLTRDVFVLSWLQGGDLLCGEQVSAPSPLLLQWVKTEHALVMLFNNGTLQVLTKQVQSKESPARHFLSLHVVPFYPPRR